MATRKKTAKKQTSPTLTALVVGVWQEGKGTSLSEDALALSQVEPTFQKMAELGELTGEAGKTVTLYHPQFSVDRIIAVGLGTKEKFDWNPLEKAVTAATKAAAGCGSIRFAATSLSLPNVPNDYFDRFVFRTAFNANYNPRRFTGGQEHDKIINIHVERLCEVNVSLSLVSIMESRALAWARSIAEAPSNVITPEGLATEAETAAIEDGAQCRVWSTDEIREHMAGLTAVGFGSDNLPVFIEYSWHGARKSDAPLVLIGKGVTFDAGGISLKPARGMDEMKFDMSGAAVALAAVRYAAALQLPLNVTALVPACENLPSGCAVKPGDIIGYKNGKTVEVLNTDAEGRLILADALIRASELKPAAVVDIATLTGACIVALGDEMSGLFTEDKDLREELLESGIVSGDLAWPMPITDASRNKLKSSIADLANIGPAGSAGACTAAAFLSEFAPDCPWAHLDVAGTANTHSGLKVSTGRPLPLLTAWLDERAQQAIDAQKGSVDAEPVSEKPAKKSVRKTKS